MNKKELYDYTWQCYQNKQIYVAIEEMAELTKELCKYLREYETEKTYNRWDYMLEEMIDVEIMLEQLKNHFFSEEYDKMFDTLKDVKLHRLAGRLGDRYEA